MEEQDGREWMTLDEALEVTYGTLAYSSSGGMVEKDEYGEYTVTNGNLAAATTGDWSDVQRKNVLRDDVPDAVNVLGMGSDTWSYE